MQGIDFAMSFLERWQRKQTSGPKDPPTAMSKPEEVLRDHNNNLWTLARGKRVVVLGGGDTGVDCIATATRQVSDIFTIIVIIKTILVFTTRSLLILMFIPAV